MTLYEAAQLLFLLIGGHFIGDFAMQTEWVATNKNPHARERFSNEEQKNMEVIWPWLMSAHAFIHGIIVYLITHNLWIGILETALHWATDFFKCARIYGFSTDQFLHLAVKFIWVILIYQQWL